MDGAFPKEHIAYQSRLDAYKVAMEGLGLTGAIDLDVNIKVWEMIATVQHSLQGSAQRYVFRDPEEYDSQYPHDCLGLGLLRFHDRGTIRAGHQYARMEETAISADKTLQDLVRDVNNFANARLALRDGRFLIHLC